MLVCIVLAVVVAEPLETTESWTPLAAVNDQRTKRGLRPLVADAKLMALAQKVSRIRAANNIHGHIKGWQAGHATREGVGWQSSPNDHAGKKFRSCCLYGKRWKHAGVGISVSRHGTFYTLMVR